MNSLLLFKVISCILSVTHRQGTFIITHCSIDSETSLPDPALPTKDVFSPFLGVKSSFFVISIVLAFYLLRLIIIRRIKKKRLKKILCKQFVRHWTKGHPWVILGRHGGTLNQVALPTLFIQSRMAMTLPPHRWTLFFSFSPLLISPTFRMTSYFPSWIASFLEFLFGNKRIRTGFEQCLTPPPPQ